MNIGEAIARLQDKARELPTGYDTELRVSMCDGEGIEATRLIEIDHLAEFAQDSGDVTGYYAAGGPADPRQPRGGNAASATSSARAANQRRDGAPPSHEQDRRYPARRQERRERPRGGADGVYGIFVDRSTGGLTCELYEKVRLVSTRDPWKLSYQECWFSRSSVAT